MNSSSKDRLPDVVESSVLGRLTEFRAWGLRYRRTIILVAAAAFLIGMAISLAELAPAWDRMRLWPLLLICLAGVPASLILNAVELQLCAKAVDRSLGIRRALVFTTTGTISNLLPVPASVVIRGSALVAAGAGLREAGAILALAALMWLALALAVTGFSLAFTTWIGVVVAGLGTVGTLGLAFWINRRSSASIAFGFVLVRACLLVVLVARLWLAFLAIDVPVTVLEAAYYAVAGIAGTVVTVVPAGLGVSEGFAALMAGVIGASASAAFLALGVNRVVGLLICGGVAGWLWTRPPSGRVRAEGSEPSMPASTAPRSSLAGKHPGRGPV
jgi:hypothetical protein